MEKKYEIVSLGLNCMPRTVLTKGKVKPSKAEGELSCPFDLVRHKFNRVVHYIENNFDGYFDDLYFELKKKHFFDFRGKGLWQKTDGTKFFHDKDCKKNDRAKLIERITRRIENFNKILDSEKPILFVMYVADRDNNLDYLYKVLKERRKGKPFKIAAFDFYNCVSESENKDISILKLPFPVEKYNKRWNTRKFRDSELGKYFNKCLCTFVERELESF